MLLHQLPQEVATNILARLPVAAVAAVACTSRGLQQLAADDCVWASLAEAKWGPAARELGQPLLADSNNSGAGGQWQRYCCKRMSSARATSTSRSPLNLLQELYPDPWQHIICCVLCSRTSGSETIRAAVAAFFEALPTPTAVLAAADGLLQDLLHPLGLQASRMAAARSVSHGFLATDWQTPAEFHGCGQFVSDSWRIFCRGNRDSRGVADVNLKAYLAWCNRQQRGGSSSTGDAAAPSKGRKRQQLKKRPKQQQQPGQKASSRKSPRLHQQQPAGDAAHRAGSKRQRAAGGAVAADAPARRVTRGSGAGSNMNLLHY